MPIEDAIQAVIDESIALLCSMIIIKKVFKDERNDVLTVPDRTPVRDNDDGERTQSLRVEEPLR